MRTIVTLIDVSRDRNYNEILEYGHVLRITHTCLMFSTVIENTNSTFYY